MKTNQNTIINGRQVVLVPYRKEHVPRYHEWMKSEELQELTASEPLTLDEEYDMQKSWREDDDKCTFIILDREEYQKNKEETESMVGDVNLFFNEEENKHSAELEIMIAESRCRGKGFGTEAALAMMRYGMDSLGVKRFTVKIGYANVKSQRMFNKFHFAEVSRSDAFKEVTLENILNEINLKWLLEQTAHINIQESSDETR